MPSLGLRDSAPLIPESDGRGYFDTACRFGTRMPDPLSGVSEENDAGDKDWIQSVVVW
jgi:hypothetical protein